VLLQALLALGLLRWWRQLRAQQWLAAGSQRGQRLLLRQAPLNHPPLLLLLLLLLLHWLH
jgi:hypothetical protein